MSSVKNLSDEMLKIVRNPDVFGFIAFYENSFGWKFPPHLFPVAMALCDERIKNLMIIVGPGSGKSITISVCYPAWKLGHDQTQTFLDISASEGLTQGFVQASMELIEWNPWYKIVFPNVKPDKDSGWSPLRGAYVTGRPRGIPDPSYVGAGLTSKALTGKHSKNLILDDIHDPENSGNEDQCKKVIEKFYSQLLGRADPSGARFLIAGRRWAENDLYGYLIKHEADQWVVMTLPAERKGESKLYWDIQVPDGLQCCFTDESNVN